MAAEYEEDVLDVRFVFGPHEGAEAAYCLVAIEAEADRRRLIQQAFKQRLAELPEEATQHARDGAWVDAEREHGGPSPLGELPHFPKRWRLLRTINGVGSHELPASVAALLAKELTAEDQERLRNDWKRNFAQLATP